MFRFAEVSVALILAKGFNEHEQSTNVGCKCMRYMSNVHQFIHLDRSFRCRDGIGQLYSTDCEIGGLDEGGQVTKGVWGMSWR